MKTLLPIVFAITMIVSLDTLAEAHKEGHDGTNEPWGPRGGGWSGAGFESRGKKSEKNVFGGASSSGSFGGMGGFGGIRDAPKNSGGRPGGSMDGFGGISMPNMGGFSGRPGSRGPRNGIGSGSMSPRGPFGAPNGLTGMREN